MCGKVRVDQHIHMISYVKLKDGKVKVVVYELQSLLFSLIF